MSLNDYLEPTSYPTFTLEDLGLDNSNDPVRKGDESIIDPLNLNGVLGEQKANAPTAVIETDMSTPGPHNTNLSQDEISEIPTWDSKIKIIKEHADKIVDMRAVQQDIEGSGAIDRVHSDIVEATFEGLYSPHNLRGMYTTFESRTNYDMTRSFMAKKIALSVEALMTEYAYVNTDGASEQAEAILKSRDFCSMELRDTLKEAVSHIQAVTDILAQGPIILPTKDGQFIDMTNVDYSQLDIDNIKTSVPLTDAFYDHFKKMSCIWKETADLREFVDICMQGHIALHPDMQVPKSSDGLFLATILTAFGEWSADVLYDRFVVATDDNADELAQIQTDLRESISAGDDAATVIGQRGGQWVTIATKLAETQGNAVKIGEFVKAAANVAVGMASLR